MRIGQTSAIVFSSRFAGSVLGFLATIFFARELGAEVIGVYALVISLLVWLRLGATLGFGSAITKRVSEGEEQSEYFTAGLLSIGAIGAVITITLILAQPYVEAYIGEFKSYTAISVVWFLLMLLYTDLFNVVSMSALQGKRLVHVTAILSTASIGIRSVVQVILVVLGLNVMGMLTGYAVGMFAVGLIGLKYVSIIPTRPEKHHFESLFDYAKYSWLGGLESRSFNDSDIIILGLFVPSSQVGIYSVAWSIARFLKLFGGSVSQTVFPEISHQSEQESRDAVQNLLEDVLAYAGLVTIPGLVGGLVLADRLLLIYGSEFVKGTTVLGLLIVSTLFYTYQQQCVNALNALDRPDVSFQINILVTVTNVCLNFVLIWQFGWIGAAVATASSAGFGAILSFVLLHRLIYVHLPISRLGQQAVAAGVMGVVVWLARGWVEASGLVNRNILIVVALVLLGSGIYFGLLFSISRSFRRIVLRNLPFPLPIGRFQ